MDIFTILIVAFALSMDAFAVSLCMGACAAHCGKIRIALKAGFYFGIFQAIMPLTGWAAGYFMKEAIENTDHWVAFGLLFIIGIKMIYEATKNNPCRKELNTGNTWVMLSLSVATSIDALAVGLSFAFIRVPIIMAVTIIGIITFAVSFTGVHIGKKFYVILGNKAEIAGGIILMGLGVKILIEHLYF